MTYFQKLNELENDLTYKQHQLKNIRILLVQSDGRIRQQEHPEYNKIKTSVLTAVNRFEAFVQHIIKRHIDPADEYTESSFQNRY